MKILIIRTDKLGDFYVSLPFINSLIRKYDKSNIDIVLSESIYKHFSSKKYLYNRIYSYPKKNILKKIKLINNLRKKSYDKILVFDGKDGSIFLTYFLKSSLNLILVEKRKINFLTKLLLNKKKFKFFINDKIESYHAIYKKMISYCKVEYIIEDCKILKHKNLSFVSCLKNYNIESKTFSQIHLDEKWFINTYINHYTDINLKEKYFVDFLLDVINIKKKKLIVTTGILKLPFLENLKNKYFTKVNENLYEYNFNINIILLLNSSIDDLESIAINAANIITCNGPISQIACYYDINLIDILEKKLEFWYDRHISNKKNYNKLFRKDFNELSKEILNKIK